MTNRWNPIHAAAYGIVTGFVLFAALVHSGSWWPSPATSEIGLRIFLLLATVFAIPAAIRNWRVERRQGHDESRAHNIGQRTGHAAEAPAARGIFPLRRPFQNALSSFSSEAT